MVFRVLASRSVEAVCYRRTAASGRQYLAAPTSHDPAGATRPGEEDMRNSILSTVVTAAALGLILVAPVQASDPAVKCETSKLKEAGKYGKCRLKAEAKGVKSGEAADYTKCDEKFSEKWEKVEGKAEGACPTNGDVDSMNTRITTDTAEIARLLAGGTIGAAKLMSGTTDGLPETVTIDYVFENFTNDTTVVSLS